MRKLSKSEFMKLYINDMYRKRYNEKKGDYDAKDHLFTNMEKIKKRKGRKHKCLEDIS